MTTPPECEKGTSLLPLSRVHRIIKADQDIQMCSKEAIFLIGKATEYMVSKVMNQAYGTARINKRPRMIKYDDLSEIASRPEWFYISEVVPRTIPLSKALAKKAANGGGLLDTNDENHPSMPSTSGGVQQGVNPVKKGKKKAAPKDPAQATLTVPGPATKGDPKTKSKAKGKSATAAAELPSESSVAPEEGMDVDA
ncbi:hypothetical protein T439DRAFT_329312 [Meredithblackwellia eburnea MCA 4105]